MRTLVNILFFAAIIGLLAGCDKTGELFENENPELKKAQVEVTVPFKAEFTVTNHSDYSDRRCATEENPNIFFLTMKGEGTATQLGKLSTCMTFCCIAGPLPQYYYGGDGTFVAANGDELYFIIPEGWIVLNNEDNKDYYRARFNDEFEFAGGTGKFEGASGKWMTNAYVHNGNPNDPEDNWHTDFFSEGTLTLLKGKK